jgi:hypothetical protein
MTNSQLIMILQQLPPDAQVFLDTDEYPAISGAYTDTQQDEVFGPRTAVLLETSDYPTRD